MKKVRQGDKSVYIHGNEGGVHIHGQSENLPHVLTRAPIVPEEFLGREQDLKNLRKQLTKKDKLLLLVNGQGGIGKTTLAAKYYDTYKSNYKHVIWVLSEKSIGSALLKLGPDLGLPEALFEHPPKDKLNWILNRMANLPGPCLMVIDNANEVQDLDAFIHPLQTCGNFHVLVTTRITEHSAARVFPVGGLSLADAKKLFKAHYPNLQDSEEELLAQLIENIGYNTLLIELLAKNLKEVNRLNAYTLSELIVDLHQSLIGLSESSKIKTGYQATDQKLRVEKPEDIVLAMYDFSTLSEKEKQIISVFAVLPNEPIPYRLIEVFFPDEDLEAPLLGIAEKGWVDFDEANKVFKVNQVVQDVALVIQEEQLATDVQPLIQALGVYLAKENILHRDQFHATTLLVSYARSVVSKISAHSDDLGFLCQGLGNYFIATGDLTQALSNYGRMNATYTHLAALYPDESHFRHNLAISYSKLGETHAALGQSDQALTFFEKKTSLFEELVEAVPNNVAFKYGLAISYEKLGDTLAALGQLDKALTFFEKNNNLCKELVEEVPNNVAFKNGLAVSYSKIGDTYAALGQSEKALAFFEKYNNLCKELLEAVPNNDAFKNGLAISYSKLGGTYAALGQSDIALAFFEKETSLFEELFAEFPNNVNFKNGLAISFEKLGGTHASLGQSDKALTFFEKFTNLCKELVEAVPNKVDFKNGLAISYSKLGDTHAALGQVDKALAFFEKYNNLRKELFEAVPNNVAFKNGLAISYAKLAQVYRDHLKDREASKSYFLKAEKLWRELTESAPKVVVYQQYHVQVQNDLASLEDSGSSGK